MSKASEDLANEVRRDIIRMTHRASAAHVASSLSCADILAVLYKNVARFDPVHPDAVDRDVIVVSKGHAAAAVYGVLAHSGFMPVQKLESYGDDGSPLVGHVTAGVPGIEFSTGSLGHGLPFSVGVAVSLARSGSKRRVFVVMSDGEMDEGSNWEAALLAGHHVLSRLTVVIDRNRLQSLTTTEKTVALEPLSDKWRAFGWEVATVDGHDHQRLTEGLCSVGNKPRCVIADTVKGRGVSFMENRVAWHYRPPSESEMATALMELARENGE